MGVFPHGAWAGETVFVIGSGPSLTKQDAQLTEGRKVIAVNCAIRLAPHAGALYAGDHKWWAHYGADWIDFGGYRLSFNAQACEEFGCIPVPHFIGQVKSSGYQAIWCAKLMGAKRIVLLGFDMKAHRGMNHWHGEHSGGTLTNPNWRLYAAWKAGIDALHAEFDRDGVVLVNATRQTALSLPRVPLEEVI